MPDVSRSMRKCVIDVSLMYNRRKPYSRASVANMH